MDVLQKKSWMLVNSLPIYLGNRLVGLDFNPDSFINAGDYPSLEALVERIIELDTMEKSGHAVTSFSENKEVDLSH